MAIAEPAAPEQVRGLYLPRPPDVREKYAYFGKTRRWVFAFLLIASAGVLYGYVHVAERAWVVSPLMWLLLMVIVPPVVVNFWLRIGHPRLTLAEHQAIVASYRAQGETVDVFLPSAGEPLAVLNNTFQYASTMSWNGPKTVYVLDDSARETVHDLADRYGFQYIVRPHPGEMKKAGNLIHALGVSAGDFIAVIDADFAVRPEFLYETMPYFSDPKVGIVQTAQYFDVTNRSFSYIQRYAGTLQEIFFRFIQPARDRYQAAICAGTNLVYRRAAVVAAGGFAQVPIGEDVHSGVKLFWAGHETRYLPLCLAKGVAPIDFPSLANQQARWCRSSMLLMIEKHFQEAPFTWKQRAAFWAAFLYYMSSAALLLTGPFPTLTMLWFFPQRVYPHNYLPAAARSRRDALRVPAAEPGLAAHDLPRLHDQLVLSRVRDLVRDQGPCRRVGPDRCIARRGPGSRDGEPHPVHLDCGRSGAALVRSGPAGQRVRLAPVLGDGPARCRAALHARAVADSQQGRLEAPGTPRR